MARSTVAVKFTGDVSHLKGSLDDLDGKMSGVGSKIGSLAKTAAVGFAAVGGAALVGAKMAIDAASNLNETISKSNTVFKNNGAAIEKWADGAAKSIGQSKQQALEAASSFGNMFIQLGIGSDKAAGMSTAMTELASDFASFHNADITEVLEAQQAAFRGEYDSVQKFVPTINAAAVEQKALEMGLKGTTKELTAQDKALATQELLLEGAGDAMGDFARTSGSLANKQRILSARFEDVKAKIGTALIPVALTLANVFADKVLPALEKVGSFLKPLGELWESFINAFQAKDTFGFTEKDGAVGQVMEMAVKIRAALDGVIVWVQQNWPKIREVITQVMETVGAIIKGVVSVITTVWNNFGNNVLELIQRVWPRIQQIIEGAMAIIQGVIKTVTSLIKGDWSEVWEGIKQVFRGVWEAIQGILGTALELIRSAVGVALEILGSIFKSAFEGIKNAVFAAISQVVQWHIELPQRLLAALGSLGGLLVGHGRAVIQGLWEGMQGVWASAKSWVAGFGNSIGHAVGNLGRTLYNAGVAVLRGLWDGMKHQWENVKGWVGSLGGKIASLKGPIDKDRVLLTNEGAAIIEGLGKGMLSAWPGVERLLASMSPAIQGQIGAATAMAAGAAGVSAGGASFVFNFNGPVASQADAERWVAEALGRARDHGWPV